MLLYIMRLYFFCRPHTRLRVSTNGLVPQCFRMAEWQLLNIIALYTEISVKCEQISFEIFYWIVADVVHSKLAKVLWVTKLKCNWCIIIIIMQVVYSVFTLYFDFLVFENGRALNNKGLQRLIWVIIIFWSHSSYITLCNIMIQ